LILKIKSKKLILKKIYRIEQLFIVLIVILCLSNSLVIQGQDDIGQIWDCKTALSENAKSLLIITETVVDTSPKTINTFFHVLRRNDGTGGLSQAQIDDWISVLCEDYIEYQIIIKVIGQSNLNNSTFYNGITDTNYPSLITTNTHSNAIDIYLLSPNDTYSRAVNIPGIAMAVGGSFQGTSVLSHEFGHCLGLFHTHSGRGCLDFINCSENINGSNCSTCGDLVCDTPADPCLQGNVNTSCEYIGDPSFNPDVHNIMSYAPPDCLNRLTTEQMERIHFTISNNSIFIARSSKPSISGPSVVCTSDSTFSISYLPSVDSIIWNTGPYLTVYSGKYTNSPVIKATGSGSSWVSVRLVTACGSVTLPQKTVWAGVPAPEYIDFVNIGPNYPASMVLCNNMPNDGKVKWNGAGDVLEYSWSVKDDGGNIWQVVQHPMDRYPDIPMADVQFSKPYGSVNGWVNVKVKARNQCIGWGEYKLPALQFSTSSCYTYFLNITPNPASGETVLSIENQAEVRSIEEDAEWGFEVYNSSQSLKEKKTKIKGNEHKIQTAGWKEGVYLIRVKYKDEILTGKLVVKK
jgi:hypothetical protein